MLLTDQLSQPNLQLCGLGIPAVSIVVLALCYIIPYLTDPKGIRTYPGPWLAKFSCLWYARVTLAGRVQTSVKELHEKYGTFVRISPNEVSICDPEALQTIYARSGNVLKSPLYDAFAPFGAARSVFNTTSREDHARKRKITSHIMSAKSLAEFSSVIYVYDRMLVSHWDEMCAAATKGMSGTKGECTWKANGGRAWFNAMPWFNYLAFDVIGDLAFGAPFGMLSGVTESTPVVASTEKGITSYTSSSDVHSIQYDTINSVQVINQSSAFSSFLGILPPYIRPFVMKLPVFKQSLHARRALSAMAVTAVSKRINSSKPILRADFLSRLLEGRDAQGNPMRGQELSSEALSLLVGGSDTTSNSTAAITYHLAQNRIAQMKLQAALDVALGPPDLSLSLEDALTEDNLSKLKDCQYLHDVINEGLRLHSTVGFGLPRVVPAGGMTILGRTFAPGTVVSTPGFALHHVKSLWGEDADVFNPDRWSTGNKAAMWQAFAPFSIGSRGCLGRNLAQMELQSFIASIFHRYDVVLDTSDQKLEVHEGFVRKPLRVMIGIKLRSA